MTEKHENPPQKKREYGPFQELAIFGAGAAGLVAVGPWGAIAGLAVVNGVVAVPALVGTAVVACAAVGTAYAAVKLTKAALGKFNDMFGLHQPGDEKAPEQPVRETHDGVTLGKENMLERHTAREYAWVVDLAEKTGQKIPDAPAVRLPRIEVGFAEAETQRSGHREAAANGEGQRSGHVGAVISRTPVQPDKPSR